MNEKFCQRLRGIREGDLRTKKFMASAFGITDKTYACYERGDRLPSLDFFKKVCERYGCTFDYLSGRSDDYYGYYRPSLSELVESYFLGSPSGYGDRVYSSAGNPSA